MTLLQSTLVIRSTWGAMTIAVADGSVQRCSLPVADSSAMPPLRLGREELKPISACDADVLSGAAHYVRELFSGRHVVCPPVARQPGTVFFGRIMHALRRVPFGSIITYGELAGAAGYAGAARAAGTACGANHLPLFIPCHRVVGAGGRIGGFSSGLAWKKQLLLAESAPGGLRACA